MYLPIGSPAHQALSDKGSTLRRKNLLFSFVFGANSNSENGRKEMAPKWIKSFPSWADTFQKTRYSVKSVTPVLSVN